MPRAPPATCPSQSPFYLFSALISLSASVHSCQSSASPTLVLESRSPRPIRSHLIGAPKPPSAPLSRDPAADLDPDAAAHAMSESLGLNADQSAVLSHVASWFRKRRGPGSTPTSRPAGRVTDTPCEDVEAPGAAWAQSGVSGAQVAPTEAYSPVVLVHGPFGTGKSTLLAGAIRFLASQMQPKPLKSAPRGGPPVMGRVLVASHTNVAVDRVLIALKVRALLPLNCLP